MTNERNSKTQVPEQMMLDLRDWDVSAKAALDHPLDLRPTSERRAAKSDFYEAASAYVSDPMLVPLHSDTDELVNKPTERGDRDHLPVTLGVVIAAIAFGLIVWAVARQILSLSA